MNSPYATIAEADVYLALDYDNWLTLGDPEKTEALQFGRFYLDSKFTCSYTDDTDAPDELKWANSLAANLHSQGKLYFREKEVSESSVTAGSVKSTKKYSVGSVDTVDVPEIAQINALLKGICERSSAGTVSLVRN